jgi:branched-chain amino acid transport system permease protein
VAYHGLATELLRHAEYWRLLLGTTIVVLVIAFPRGIVGFVRGRAAGAP